MDQYTQANRLIAIESPLGKDKLLLTSLHGHEHISDLFEFQITALSNDLAIKPDALIGLYVLFVAISQITAAKIAQYDLGFITVTAPAASGSKGGGSEGTSAASGGAEKAKTLQDTIFGQPITDRRRGCFNGFMP